MVSAEIQKAFAECGAFYRDTVLSPVVLSLYRVGILFREPTFCDSTYKFGGFTAQHRYLIFSANARCVDKFSQHPEWGLCLWESDRILKIIDIQENAKHTQTALLEVPEHLLNHFVSPFLSDMERQFAAHAAERFNLALKIQPLPDHQPKLWLDRLSFPLGIDDCGRFFQSWQPASPTHGSDPDDKELRSNRDAAGDGVVSYKVLVDDNYDHMDESQRYELGEFTTWEAAVAASKQIIDNFLVSSYRPGMTAKELYRGYVGFGEDPFIVSASTHDDSLRFSAWSYAEERCVQLCQSGIPPKSP